MNERLRELEAIVGLSTDLYFILDINDVIQRHYARNAEDLYLSPEQFLGKKMGDILPRTVGDTHRRALEWVLEHKQPRSFDYWLTFKDGKSRAFQGKLSLTDTNTVILVITDITDRLNESKFRNLADAIEAAVGIHRNENWLYVNRTMERETGYSSRELLGMHFAALIDPEYRDLVAARGKARSEGLVVPESYEVPVITRSGKRVFWTLRPIRIEYEGAPAVLVTAHDCTSLKLQEIELQNAKNTADAANHAKSRFLANMSHEIRTPMVAILGFSEMIQDPGLTLTDRNKCVETITRNGKHLLALINDILDLSRVESGEAVVEKDWTYLETELLHVRDNFRSACDRNGVVLTVSFASDLPNRIHTSAIRLRQILINIIGNAVKFCAKGSIHVQVSWADASARSMIKFTVKDTGIGIPQEGVRDLFRPFTQVDQSMSRKFGGTGLGLALARQLARSLGGDVVLEESAPNVGSTFVVTVQTGPTDPEMVLAKPQKPVEANDTLHETLLTGARILLVEDSSDCQALFEHVLETAGAHVVMTNDGLEAIRLGSQPNFDLILMDIQLPSTDGETATRLLRKNGVKIPIIALTAHAMTEDRMRCLDAGCDDWISKPTDARELVEKAAEWIRIRRNEDLIPGAGRHEHTLDVVI